MAASGYDLDAIREENNGNELATFFDITARLMRGEAWRSKAGYSADNAAGLAAEVTSLSADERREAREAMEFAFRD